MFAGHKTLKLALGLSAVVALGTITGCNQDSKTASIDTAAQQFAMAPNDGCLGAGDSLGAQVFSTSDDTVRMAVLRQTETAVAVAEAKVKDGSYEQWYASFDRDPGAVRLAKAREAQGNTSFADVPTPDPVR